MSNGGKYAKCKIKLVPTETVVGASYNPRKTDLDRLEHVKSSLEHLGFVLPLYAQSKTGILLSGHQRSKAAHLLGYTNLPVMHLNVPAKDEKGLNLTFNKATNDLDVSKINAKAAYQEFVEKTAGEVDKGDPVPPDSFPCMETEKIEVNTLLHSLSQFDELTEYHFKVGLPLIVHKAFMPLVVTESGDLVNGAFRLYAYWKKGFEFCDVVTIPDNKYEFANYSLNLLAMDFDVQDHFKEELRYNAYRRLSTSNQIVGLSRTFSYFPMGRTMRNSRGTSKMRDGQVDDLDMLPDRNPEARRKYHECYGKTVVDFGAGTFHDSELMENAGFNVLSFEPYYVRETGEPSSDLSRQYGKAFLDKLRETKRVDSVISSFTLNSIPHHKDRMAVLCIIAALCRVDSKAFLGTQPVSRRSRGDARNKMDANMEPNMVIGHSMNFKSQKYYHKEELEKMVGVFFNDVKVTKHSGTLYVRAQYPKRVRPELLGEALEIEFNMPYSDGTTMDLVDEAKESFSKYLGVKIP